MPRKALPNLVTEDIREADLVTDAAPKAKKPKEEVRYYPLLDGCFTESEAAKLLAERQAENL